MKKLSIALVLTCAFVAKAEPLKIIVPYGAGGNVDLQARVYAKELSAQGVENVVLNRPGADSAIGIRATASAKPDGNTILYSCSGGITQRSAESSEHREMVKQLVPVYKTMTIGQLFVTKKGNRIGTWEDLIAELKAGKTVSVGTNSGIMKDAVEDTIGNNRFPSLIQVPFQGDVQTYAAVMQGTVDVGTITMVWANKAEQGELNIIAVTSNKSRYGIKSLKERGYDVATNQFCGFWAPPGVSKETVNHFYSIILRAHKTKEVDTGIRTIIHGLPVEPVTPEAFAVEIENEYQFLLKRNSAKIARTRI